MAEARTDRVDDAAADGRLVRVVRRKGWDRLDGSIVSVGGKWLVIALQVDAGFNGYALVRRSDVRRVEFDAKAGFVSKALAAEGHWPLPGLDGLDLATTQGVLRSTAQLVPLVSIHYEPQNPNACLIGVPHDFARRKFKLQTVTPTAEWEVEDSTFRYRSVSRIDLLGAYEQRLAAVAGASPRPV